jgi:hypothetical protein
MAAAGWFELLHPTAAEEPLDFSAHAPQVPSLSFSF